MTTVKQPTSTGQKHNNGTIREKITITISNGVRDLSKVKGWTHRKLALAFGLNTFMVRLILTPMDELSDSDKKKLSNL
jgi:hypothetical protein